MKKLQLFDQNRGLSALQKCQFCLLFKSMFILSRKACFRTRTSPNTFLRVFCIKRNVNNISNFSPKPWINPFGKMPKCFRCSERLVCYIKWKIENRFFTIYFHGLWHGNTEGYTGLVEVTGGYKRLQGETGGDKGLQGVTMGYMGLQRIIESFL